MKQQIISAGQGQSYEWAHDHILVKTPHPLTEGRVTVVEDTLKPGFHLARHYHKAMVEIFYILAGEIEFKFDNETILATTGMTLNIPPLVWHEVTCANGGKLITIFSPGGFDDYLIALQRLTDAQLGDESFMTGLAEKHDTWAR
ncbi:MAG: cupin domain-containing protein [Chloroflexota bacterium]|nr:cupin domain-containing protein [Chloroflexota bacterium]